jgi:hypothetical protein
MKIFPSGSPVLLAEQRLEQSKQQLHQQLGQARSALKSIVSQPWRQLIVIGIVALAGFWLARGKTAVARFVGASLWPPVQSLVIALLIRFVTQRMARRESADEI